MAKPIWMSSMKLTDMTAETINKLVFEKQEAVSKLEERLHQVVMGIGGSSKGSKIRTIESKIKAARKELAILHNEALKLNDPNWFDANQS